MERHNPEIIWQWPTPGRKLTWLAVMGAVLLVLLVLDIALGSVRIPVADVIRILTYSDTGSDHRLDQDHP